jgi:hypothetical protein
MPEINYVEGSGEKSNDDSTQLVLAIARQFLEGLSIDQAYSAIYNSPDDLTWDAADFTKGIPSHFESSTASPLYSSTPSITQYSPALSYSGFDQCVGSAFQNSNQEPRFQELVQDTGTLSANRPRESTYEGSPHQQPSGLARASYQCFPLSPFDWTPAVQRVPNIAPSPASVNHDQVQVEQSLPSTVGTHNFKFFRQLVQPMNALQTRTRHQDALPSSTQEQRVKRYPPRTAALTT